MACVTAVAAVAAAAATAVAMVVVAGIEVAAVSSMEIDTSGPRWLLPVSTAPRPVSGKLRRGTVASQTAEAVVAVASAITLTAASPLVVVTVVAGTADTIGRAIVHTAGRACIATTTR